MNYTLQDILGTTIAFLLFPLVIVLPGYVSGWAFDLFEFRKRHPLTRFAIALVLSVATSPILFFLAYRLISGGFALFLVLAFLIAFAGIMLRSPKWTGPGFSVKTAGRLRGVRRVAFIVGGVWVAFVVLYLADWQLGEKVYYTVIAYDYTTRVSVIDAITRTGVPPLNPSYHPGHPEQLTFLYYFWYLICSLVDQIGGDWVNARTALNASAAWCGLALMTVIALYLRQRNPGGSVRTWRQSLLGIGLLLISGLDIIPVAIYTLRYAFRWMWGDIEHWNEQITAWLGSILWAPLHIASLVACMTGLMLFLYARQKTGSQKSAAMAMTGLAFASAFGLSVWVTLVFVVFWGMWMIVQVFRKDERKQAWLMIVPGLIAAVAILPFVLDLIPSTGTANGNGSFPFGLWVREFYPAARFVRESSSLVQSLVFLITLPINYLMELGFFLVAGLLWLQLFAKDKTKTGAFIEAETLLLATTFLLATFLRSKVILSNDFGWRSWLSGQFILLVWGTDLLRYLFNRKLPEIIKTGTQVISPARIKRILIFFVTVGLLTTLSDLILLRTWPMMTDAGAAGFPNMLSGDNRLGERTLAARKTYEFIDRNLPEESIIQFNPAIRLDRPAGLYRTRQAVISTHTLYGVSEAQADELIDKVMGLFDPEDSGDWQTFDRICKENQISAIILSDYDPAWKDLETLGRNRTPLFENSFFAVFSCGQ